MIAIPSSHRYRVVRARIEDGDLLLYKRPESFIAEETLGDFSHSAMAKWCGQVLMCGESREYCGARLVTLSSQVEKYPGVIHVFRPQCPPRVRQLAADWMVRHAGHEYGYGAILAYSVLRAPLVNWTLRHLHLLASPSKAVEPLFRTPKFCSAQTEWCYRTAAKFCQVEFDPHPGLASQYVTPNDQAHSSDFKLFLEGLTP